MVPGGYGPKGMVQGGMVPEGYGPRGTVSGSAWSWGYSPMLVLWEGTTPPIVDRMTHSCENTTFPQLRFCRR